MAENIKTAFLISGGGTTAEAAIKAWGDGKIPGLTPDLVISSKPDAGGLQKVNDYNFKYGKKIQTAVVRRSDSLTSDLFGEKMLQILQRHEINLIAQLGYLALTPPNVVEAFKNHIFNQHPAPLEFGGKGMYGLSPHLAVIAFAWMTGSLFQTEATTHRVTEVYDKGDIIRRKPMNIPLQSRLINIKEIAEVPDMQKQIMQAALDTQKDLLPLEHENVIATLIDFASGNVPVFRREKSLIPTEHQAIFEQAKKLAVTLVSQLKTH